MSKPESREEILALKALAARETLIAKWQPQLGALARQAKVKPTILTLAKVALESGALEIQLCVAGLNDTEARHNFAKIEAAIGAFTQAARLPALPVKRHHKYCPHISVAGH